MPSDLPFPRIAGFMNNQYLILEPGDLTLVDTGMPGNHKKILETLARLGHPPQDLRRILITHSDADHYGALKALLAATGARAYAGALEAEAIRRGTSSRPVEPKGLLRPIFALFGRMFRAEPAPVDEVLAPGQVLPLLGGLQVLDSAGHTPGHLSFFSPATGILFAGDSITVHGRELRTAMAGTTWDREAAQRSYEMQVALQPRVVCAGHGYWEA